MQHCFGPHQCMSRLTNADTATCTKYVRKHRLLRHLHHLTPMHLSFFGLPSATTFTTDIWSNTVLCPN